MEKEKSKQIPPLGLGQKSSIKVALIGNPNCGKSTLFNILTGLHQSTANFPGATVDKKTGSAKIPDVSGKIISVEFLDLPGAYSLHPKSPDEKIAVEEGIEGPDDAPG